MNHIVDSVVQKRMKVIQKQAQRDLELRMPIRMKPLVDSILNKKMTIPPAPKMESNDHSTSQRLSENKRKQ